MAIYGKYETEHELGRGASGITYVARRPDTQQQAAVKVLVLPHTLQGADRADYIERFTREANAAGLVQHPGVPEIFAVGQEGDEHFIAMEYCPGKTLQQTLNEGGPLPAPQAVAVVAQVLSVLEAAHGMGIYHRDIKPENIMLAPDGRSIKVMDFGIARLVGDETITRTGSVIGTPSYLSPEQATGKKVDGRSDLFSVGVLLHELLTGQRPFNGSSFPALLHAIVYGEPEIAASIPPPLARIIRLALQKDPARRYAEAEQMRQALEHCLTVGVPLVVPPPSPGADPQATLLVDPEDTSGNPAPAGFRLPVFPPANPRDAYVFCGAVSATLVALGLLVIALTRATQGPETAVPVRTATNTLPVPASAAAPSTSSGFGTPSAGSGFGSSPAGSGFGTPPARPGFGSPPAGTGFGATSTAGFRPAPASPAFSAAPRSAPSYTYSPPVQSRSRPAPSQPDRGPAGGKGRSRSSARPRDKTASLPVASMPFLGQAQPVAGVILPPQFPREPISNPAPSPPATQPATRDAARPTTPAPASPSPAPALAPASPSSVPAAGPEAVISAASPAASGRNLLIPDSTPPVRRVTPPQPRGELWLDTRTRFYHTPGCPRAPQLIFREVFRNAAEAAAAVRASQSGPGRPYRPCPHCMKGEYQ